MPPIDVAYQAGARQRPPECATAALWRPLQRAEKVPQVPLLTVMLGNLAEKSLALAATFTAT